MHVKTFVFDEKVVLTGSCNFSYNAIENNKEHLFRITSPEVVRKVVEDYNLTFSQGTQATHEHVNKMMESWTKKEAAKKSSRSSMSSSDAESEVPLRSKSLSVPRKRSSRKEIVEAPLQRKLSTQLDTLNEESSPEKVVT